MKGNDQLGDFLRSRRMRLRPDEVGIDTSARRRRLSGLRREEVAERAGISTEWYVKLEQGRAVFPSEDTLAALADALLLDAFELDHMRRLALQQSRPAYAPEAVPQHLITILHSLPQPAYITGERWDVLHWNDAAESVFAFGTQSDHDRNILLYMLTSTGKTLFGEDWAPQMRRMVSRFRVSYGARADDPAFQALIAELDDRCQDFAAWWAGHDVGATVSGVKQLHTSRGVMMFEHATFHSSDISSLRLTLYTRI